MRLDSRVLVASLGLASALTACAESPPDVCDRARELAASCTGVEPPPPPEGCVGSFAEASADALERGCEAVGDGKYDESSWYCQPRYTWLGMCRPQAIEDAAAVSTLDDACGSRTDALCRALRDGHYEDARTAARAVTAAGGIDDAAVRYYVRERALAVFTWRVLDHGRRASFSNDADQLLAEHFPAYQVGSIEMARHPVAPAASRTCSTPREALLIFPGVVRLTGRDEFAGFIEAARRELPCLEVVRVDTGSFVDPGVNAAQAKRAVAALDARLGRKVPLHLLGYSQGAANALRTLTDDAGIAGRTRTVVTMNSAAHGSEVANLMSSLLGELGQSGCAAWPVITRPLCEWADARGVKPSDGVLRAISTGMGVPVEGLQQFIAAEDEISTAPNLRAFLVGHRPGVDSLTSAAAAAFWAQRGSRLPTTAMYVSFRAVITDPDRNLPTSNALFAALLDRANAYRPWNDMQVRLVNQALGGPLARVEVVGRVAEGNHWQWQLAEGAVPASVMDPDMVRRTPDVDMLLAHYQALQDAGLVLAAP